MLWQCRSCQTVKYPEKLDSAGNDDVGEDGNSDASSGEDLIAKQTTGTVLPTSLSVLEKSTSFSVLSK